MLKVLHFADVHARDADIDEIKKCLDFIVEQAKAEKPDLIVHAGDTFHSRDVKLDSPAAKLVVDVFSRLADIAPVAAVVGTPSHDGLAAEILPYLRSTYQIYLATRPEQIGLLHPLDGGFTTCTFDETESPLATISFLPPPTKEHFVRGSGSSIAQSDQDISTALSGVLSGFGAMAGAHKCPHILIGHVTVKGAVTSTGQQMTGREIEISREQLALANADLVCLGHIHKAQEFYSGSIYRENWGETEDKGFYIHEIEGGKVATRFIKTPTRKLHQVKFDLTDPDADLRDLDMILYQLSPEDINDASIRVELRVYQDEAAALDRGAIERFYLDGDARAREVDVRIVRVPRETVRSTNILKLQALRDKVMELAATRGEMVPDRILAKADMLEMRPTDEIMEAIASA